MKRNKRHKTTRHPLAHEMKFSVLVELGLLRLIHVFAQQASFPPIYFIHLKRRKDRLDATQVRFHEKIWASVRVVDALDGAQPKERLLEVFRARNMRPFPDWVVSDMDDPVLFRRPGTGKPFSGKLGEKQVPYNVRWYTQPQKIGTVCSAASHHDAWERIAQASEEWAVVLEDDQAIPSLEEFEMFVQDVNSLNHFDIIYFFPGSHFIEAEKQTRPHQYFKPMLWTFGAQAYVVSRAFAQELVNLRILNCATAVDEFLPWVFNPEGHPRRERWTTCFGHPSSAHVALVYDRPLPTSAVAKGSTGQHQGRRSSKAKTVRVTESVPATSDNDPKDSNAAASAVAVTKMA